MNMMSAPMASQIWNPLFRAPGRWRKHAGPATICRPHYPPFSYRYSWSDIKWERISILISCCSLLNMKLNVKLLPGVGGWIRVVRKTGSWPNEICWLQFAQRAHAFKWDYFNLRSCKRTALWVFGALWCLFDVSNVRYFREPWQTPLSASIHCFTASNQAIIAHTFDDDAHTWKWSGWPNTGIASYIILHIVITRTEIFRI